MIWRGDVLHAGGAAVCSQDNMRLFAYIVPKGEKKPNDTTFLDCSGSSRDQFVPNDEAHAMPGCTHHDFFEFDLACVDSDVHT